MTKRNYLVKKPANWNVKIENTLLHRCAYVVETNLIAGGAIADKDYTILDVYNIAAQMCIEAQLNELLSKITDVHSNAILDTEDDDEDDAEESKNITDAEKLKPKLHFHNLGYQ